MFCRYGLSPKESQFWDGRAGWRDNAIFTSKLKSQVDGQAKKDWDSFQLHEDYRVGSRVSLKNELQVWWLKEVLRIVHLDLSLLDQSSYVTDEETESSTIGSFKGEDPRWSSRSKRCYSLELATACLDSHSQKKRRQSLWEKQPAFTMAALRRKWIKFLSWNNV